MNARKLLVSVLMLGCVLLSACAPVATPPVPTAVPPTAIPTVILTFDVSVTPPIAKVIAEWRVTDPNAIVVGFGSIWVTGHSSSMTTRIDPASNKVIAVIKGTGIGAEQMFAVGDGIWVTGHDNDTTWIDPATNSIASTVPPVPGELHYGAYGFNSLWLTTSDNKLARIDPATNEILASIPYADGIADCQGFVFATHAAVWVDQCDNAELIKIDPATNSVVSKTLYATLIGEAKTQTSVPAGKATDFIWISLPDGLLRIDPNTGAGSTFLPLNPSQSGYGFVTVTEDAVWVGGDSQINRVNAATNQIDATYETDSGFNHIGIGFGSVWLANYDKNLVQRLDITP